MKSLQPTICRRRLAQAVWGQLLFAALIAVVDRPVLGDLPGDARVLRRPVALQLAGDFIWVANRESGTVSVVGTTNYQVVNEFAVGRRLTDLKFLPGGDFALATDEAAHELILLRRDGSTVTVVQRLPVSSYPVGIAGFDDRAVCSVASRWSRRLTVVAISPAGGDKSATPRLAVCRVIDLPFVPRPQWLDPSQRWLVAAVPAGPANCTFGGSDHKTLFITARKGFYAIDLDVAGAQP